MKLLRRTLIVLLVIIIRVWSDDTQIGTGAHSVYPLNNDKIEMVAESVYIDLMKMEAECNFLFWNSSKETLSVLLGFPGPSPNTPYVDVSYAIIKDFQSYVDGKAVNIETKDDTTTWERWYIKKVIFEPLSLKRVKDIYKVTFSGSSSNDLWFNYTMKTGANWKGKIGKADIYIRFRCLPCEIVDIKPDNYLINDSLIEWHFEYFEPTENIGVNFKPIGWQDEKQRIMNEKIIGERCYEPIQLTFSEEGEYDPYYDIYSSFIYTKMVNQKKVIAFKYLNTTNDHEEISIEHFKDMALPFEEMCDPITGFYSSANQDFYCSVKQGDNYDIYHIQYDYEHNAYNCTNLTKGTQDTDEFGVAFLSGGDRELAYYCVDKNGNSDIWIVENNVYKNRRKITDNMGKCRHPNSLNDKFGLVFESERNGNTDIYYINMLDGDNTPIQLTQYHGYDGKPALWGNKIIFVSDRSGNKDIWMMDASGDNLLQITKDLAEDNDPCWLHSGNAILFTSTRRDGVSHVFMLPIKTEWRRQYMNRNNLAGSMLIEANEMASVLFIRSNPSLNILGDDISGAKRKYQEISDSFPDQSQAHAALFELGKFSLYEGDTLQALSFFDAIITDIPDNARIFLEVGALLEYIGEWNRALQIYLKVIRDEKQHEYWRNEAEKRIKRIKGL